MNRHVHAEHAKIINRRMMEVFTGGWAVAKTTAKLARVKLL